MSARHVLIVGGGITGMAAAFYLERAAADRGVPIAITLVEASDRLGGKLGTLQHDGMLIDIGPDSFTAHKPAAAALCRELGMEADLVSPIATRFSLLFGNRLYPVPHELVSLAPSRPEAILKAGFLSVAGKARALAEGAIPARGDVEDESLGSFMRRRFGDEFAVRFVEPLLGGVHAGDPEKMSMAAIYPSFWQMEKEFGSISRALLSRRLSRSGTVETSPRSPFVALRGGMQSLVDRLRERLSETQIVERATLCGLGVEPGGRYACRLSTGESLCADAVILAVPAAVSAPLVAPLSRNAADLLSGIQYASTAVVSLAWRTEHLPRPLDGSGFLVPRSQQTAITGCTFTSSKWPDRCSAGTTLVRAFAGSDGPGETITDLSDDDLVMAVRRDLSTILGIGADPTFCRVNRWPQAMPQYTVGHLKRVEAIELALARFPGLILAGSSYRGAGIPDCIRQAADAAAAALRACSEPARARAGTSA
ncbi:MAG: protoporphyrinogen oxidase [Armatimonadetes bacterium]|nr:protoporphyrinogen oxidase [Armatimonadota bacterium]MDE2206355.1 protoporphyrinogen oxidase [Armatimonadota bacterium]